MKTILSLLILADLILFISGLISPKVSLFWYKKQPSRKISSLVYGLSLLILFALLGSLIDDKTVPAQEKVEVTLSQHQKDSIAEGQKQAEIAARKKITFTACDLVSYYSKNEIAADNNFKGKSFYVTGYIDHIGKDLMDNSYVTLKSDDPIRNVQCFVDDQDILAKLQNDQKVTVYGECDGLMMNVLMKNCNIEVNLNE